MMVWHLLMLTEILAASVIFVSGIYAGRFPAYGLAGLALGTGWIALVNACLMRLVEEGIYDVSR